MRKTAPACILYRIPPSGPGVTLRKNFQYGYKYGYKHPQKRPQNITAPKSELLILRRFMFTLGQWCKEDLNRLWPWVEKIWALHPYFPELMEKKRAPLEGVELVR